MTSESEPIIVHTDTGLLNVSIVLDDAITESPSHLAHIRTAVTILSLYDQYVEDFIVRIDRPQHIVLKPGKYSVVAKIGSIQSDPVEIEIISGETVVMAFYFGKRPE